MYIIVYYCIPFEFVIIPYIMGFYLKSPGVPYENCQIINIKNNKLDLNIRDVPDCIYDLAKFKNMLEFNDIKIFVYTREGNMTFDHISLKHRQISDMYYKDFENIAEDIKIYCKYNIVRGINGIELLGHSHDLFYEQNMPYRKKKIILLIDDNTYCNVQKRCMEEFNESDLIKIIEENPDYNFTKFSNNSDIKIALKD